MTAPSRRRRLASQLGLVGALLGGVAGVVQVTVGEQIPQWSGAKDATTALGLLTVVLSGLAGLAALRQRNAHLTPLARAACALGVIGPGLLCLSTVGRLWYLPAALLIVAGVLTIDSWHLTWSTLVQNWHRVLLSALGGLTLLMAAGAAPLSMVIGAVGGTALFLAAWVPTGSRVVVITLVMVGAVPFAVLGWTALVPVLVAVLAALLTVFVVREMDRPPSAARPDEPRQSPSPLSEQSNRT